MGPPPFGSGNATTATMRGSRSSAFNGATAFRQWKPLPSMLMYGSFRTLQWGHRLSAVETSRKERGETLSYLPSMGPPPFGSGNVDTNYPSGIVSMPFNGATAFRQWKQYVLVSSEDLALILQWGHRLSAVETMSHCQGYEIVPSFNGATAFRQWKPLDMTAIMPAGPPSLQWGHRLSAVETAMAAGIFHASIAFNGATAFRQWKHRIALIPKRALSVLQWGHRLSAVETTYSEPLPICVMCPSMGPPPFGSGNYMRDGNIKDDDDLQWGHRLSAVETGQAASLLQPLRRPSMGPPPFGSGNPSHVIAVGLPWISFNGATAFRQWKQPGETVCCFGS